MTDTTLTPGQVLDADPDDDPNEVDPADDQPDLAPSQPSTPTAHVPGGIPGVPMTVIGANTMTAAASAAVIAAGAPATGLAAAGVAVAATGAAALRRRAVAKKAAASRTGSRSPGGKRGGSGRGSFASTGTRARHGSTGASGRGAGGRSARAGSRNGSGSAGRGGARSLRASGQAARRRAEQTGRAAAGRAGAIKAARNARTAAAPSRAQQRRQDTADRRRLADNRRAAKDVRKAERRAARRNTPPTSRAGSAGGLSRGKFSRRGTGNGRTSPRQDRPRSRDRKQGAGGLRGRLRQARRQLRARARAVRDERAARRLGRMRQVRKRARARARLWRRLAASAVRCYGRKLLAAAISVPFFAIGLITHPLGRWLGWRWMQFPGQRVYRRLAGAANRARADRDAAIREEYDAAVQAATDHDDSDGGPVGSTVRRAPRRHNAHGGSTTAGGGSTVSDNPGFLFTESASEMESAAQAYDPDGMMHVHDTIQGFPNALESVANTFAILAQKSDSEFPLEPEVGAALDDIYKALQHAIDAAEEAFKVFRTVHEQDIRRHEEPRNGPEAEGKWDTTNN